MTDLNGSRTSTTPPSSLVDVAVVGAGPAGLAAAVAAADTGCRVTLLDTAARPGGQYWRWGPATASGQHRHGWAAFTRLKGRLDAHVLAGRIDYRPGHAVFALEGTGPFGVHALADERHRRRVEVRAGTVVVATGAYDRQLPFPGWTLPGVMTAGGAQSLLKGSGVTAGTRVVVAGTGPFLLPVAAGFLAAGAGVAAVVEANDPIAWLHHPSALAAGRTKLPEAAVYLAALARHRVPVLRRSAVVAAHGDRRLRSVSVARLNPDWSLAPGGARNVVADVLATGWGFLPQTELLGAAGAELAAGPGAAAVAAVDARQRTTRPGLLAAGETTGIGGADLAVAEGTVAGVTAAVAAGRRPDVRQRVAVALAVRRRTGLRRFAAAMHEVHAVAGGWVAWPDDDTVVCRCEEVTLAELRAAVDLGADDLRSVKLLSRTGMGWCQGRICESAAATLIGGGGPAYGPRPLAVPVPLRVLAELDDPHPAL
jgi:NADPH-dependent 2,4-dienoyl-CoA reductase/sulfur reductase-like enzyme